MLSDDLMLGVSGSRSLLGLRQGIDNFLDPSQGNSPHVNILEQDAQLDQTCLRSPFELGQASSKVQELSRTNEELQQALEGARQENRAKSKAISCLNSARSTELTNAKKECTDLQEEGRAKKRRMSEMQDEILKLRRDRDSLAQDLQEVQERSQRELQALELKAADERRSLESAMARLESRLGEEKPGLEGGQAPLKARISELEQEVLALRMLLKEWWPEKEMAVQLQAKHLELDRELTQLQGARADLSAARERILGLEQEQSSLKAALAIRDAALKEAREADVATSATKENLLAFESVAREIVVAARDCKCDVSSSATVMNLRLAWSFLQSHWAKEGQKNLQNQRKLDVAADQQKDLQIQYSKLRVELSSAEVDRQDLKVKLHDAQAEVQHLTAQCSVLREALAGKSPDVELPAAASAAARVEELQASQATKQAMEALSKEAASLRGEVSRLMDVEGKARRLERVNAELWQANKELEVRVERLESADVQEADFDPRTTKILHLARGPVGQVDARSTGGDLEQHQAARQLDRFKKAMRKYVQEFREGIYHLLGWKVEMKGDGSDMRWHLTSRYHEGQELVFQLRAASTGHPAEFDLLGTSWAEHLQSDRQAMSYLEVYSSIPGFLAHVTVDRLAQQTFTR
mmetsp:Transcript_53887/g.100970  ORF Transcript_53887/g.100970 Transcript_53887/m.100970 type:complete len:640 (+) Transcript_53887:55-1974(+)